MFNTYRTELEQLAQQGIKFEFPWQAVTYFENLIAEYFGSPYAVAVDCTSHAIELCLRLSKETRTVTLPKYTYMSVPMMLDKLGIEYNFSDAKWEKRYDIKPTNIYDAATLWEYKSYIPGTLTCISFQNKKHLPIGRGGMILLDNHEQYQKLQKMSYDGRDRSKNWHDDDVQEIGYHYYMTPDDAARGILLFQHLKDNPAKIGSWQDYKDLTTVSYFKDARCKRPSQ